MKEATLLAVRVMPDAQVQAVLVALHLARAVVEAELFALHHHAADLAVVAEEDSVDALAVTPAIQVSASISIAL